MNTTKTEAKDPICGMTVDTAAALHAEPDVRTLYFRSKRCRETFLSAPADAKPDNKSGGCCCGLSPRYKHSERIKSRTRIVLQFKSPARTK